MWRDRKEAQNLEELAGVVSKELLAGDEVRAGRGCPGSPLRKKSCESYNTLTNQST